MGVLNSEWTKMDIVNLENEAVMLLERLLEIPRTSRDEGKAADLLQDFMAGRYGLETRRHGCNLWALAPNYDPSRKTLLLNAHIDTVKPVAGWTFEPFSATRVGDRIYGLGSNDDGASLVTLLQVFRHLCNTTQAYNLAFLASCEEEVSGKGGLESVLPLLPPVDTALVGEPTCMQPAVAEKGLMVLDVTEHGKSGHAARDEGDNAIYKAVRDIEWFRSHRWDRHSPLLGDVKMTVTMVNAGTQHNVIPDTCTFTVDIRSNECYTNRELFSLVCQCIEGEAKARSFRLNSSKIDPSHPIVRRLTAMGKVPFGSPTLSDQALMPFPSLKMGPGDSSRSHTADEYVCIPEIRGAIEDYIALLDGLRL